MSFSQKVNQRDVLKEVKAALARATFPALKIALQKAKDANKKRAVQWIEEEIQKLRQEHEEIV